MMEEQASGVNCEAAEWITNTLRWYGHIHRIHQERTAEKNVQESNIA